MIYPELHIEPDDNQFYLFFKDIDEMGENTLATTVFTENGYVSHQPFNVFFPTLEQATETFVGLIKVLLDQYDCGWADGYSQGYDDSTEDAKDDEEWQDLEDGEYDE